MATAAARSETSAGRAPQTPPARLRHAAMAREHGGQAFLIDHRQRFAQTEDQRHRGRERRLALSKEAFAWRKSKKKRGARAASITAIAFGLTAAKASPGGHISAFCEAPTRTSTPQSSMRTSRPPAPLTELTTSSVGVSRSKAAIAAMSATTPVALSLCTQATARYAPASNHARRAAVSGASPHSIRDDPRSRPSSRRSTQTARRTDRC